MGKKFSTTRVADMVNRLSAGLIGLGLSGHDMTVEKQDKVAIISRNRPEWLILDMACQQIGVVLCPIYPTTNVNEIEFIFNDAAIKHVFGAVRRSWIKSTISATGAQPHQYL